MLKIKEEAIENKQEEGTRAQHTPPRMVVLNEYPRKPPVKERVGLMKSAKRTAQKTLPAKERLGTKPSDFRQNNPGPSNPQNRDSRSGGDTGSSRKALQRVVKGRPDHFSQLRDQKVSQIGGYMFHKRASNSSDLEEEQKRSLR